MNSYLVICLIICSIIIILPSGIVSIIVSKNYPDQCDIIDSIGLDIKDYLFLSGIIHVSFVLLFVFIALTKICSEKISFILSGLLIFTYILFGLVWFVIGGIILFRSNTLCIQKGSIPVIYALSIWCTSAITLVFQIINLYKFKH